MNFRITTQALTEFPSGTILVIGEPDKESHFPYPAYDLFNPSTKDHLSTYGYEKYTRVPTRNELDEAVAKLTAIVEELKKPLPPAFQVGDEVYRANSGHASSPVKCEALLSGGMGLFSRNIKVDGCPDTVQVNGRHYFIVPAEKFQKEPNPSLFPR